MQRRAADRRFLLADDRNALAVANKEVAIRLVVDEITVVSIDRRHCEINIRGRHPEADHRFDNRLTTNPAAAD